MCRNVWVNRGQQPETRQTGMLIALDSGWARSDNRKNLGNALGKQQMVWKEEKSGCLGAPAPPWEHHLSSAVRSCTSSSALGAPGSFSRCQQMAWRPGFIWIIIAICLPNFSLLIHLMNCSSLALLNSLLSCSTTQSPVWKQLQLQDWNTATTDGNQRITAWLSWKWP